MKLLVTLVGLVLVLEALPYAAAPEAMREWLKHLIAMPPKVLRIIAFVIMGLGLFLCYVTQQTTIFD